MATDTLVYVQETETSQNLDWADLVTLDLAKFYQPGGKQELAAELSTALEVTGFFSVKNYGLSKSDIDTQFALAQAVLLLPESEKLKYRAALEQGDYNGWKPHADRAHPALIKQHWATIEKFSRHIHNEIVKKLLVLFALPLKLEDEEYFVKRHRYDASSGDHLRYMKYHARSDEENKKLGNVWLKGHSDMGSLTLLFRQPVAALQVLANDGTWKWVRPQAEALTVNVADALQFLANGYLKSGIHRVIAPPKDQAHSDRLAVIFMVRIEDDTELVPITDSPVLTERGLTEHRILESDGKAVKAVDWVRQRIIKNLGVSTSEKGDNEVNDVEIVKGLNVTYFD